MKIVTGYTGTPHISSNDDQARNQGIFGTGNYVLNIGNKLKATLTNATTVTLSDGEGIMQGVHFRIEPGMTEAVSISPGTSGYNRIDLICARYTKEAGTGIEDVSLVVIEGTPTTSAASAPAYTEGDILAGDTLAEFPLWKVTLSGLTPSLKALFSTPVGQKNLLWQNSSDVGNVTSINIDLTMYNQVEIVFDKVSWGTDVWGNCIVQRFEKKSNCQALDFHDKVLYYREFSISDTGISLQSSYSMSLTNPTAPATESNMNLIPIKVYGIA